MPQESEVKYRVRGFAAVRRAIRRAGGTLIESVLQADLHFDTPAQHLRRSDETLRLRRLRVLRKGSEKTGSRAVLTHKGPAKANRNIKVRPETETPVADAATMAKILAESGLRPWIHVQKRRTSYRLGRCRIELDHLPLIGRFVEIEGPHQKAIFAAAEKLGLRSKPVLRSYLQLLADYCKRHKRPFRKIVF